MRKFFILLFYFLFMYLSLNAQSLNEKYFEEYREIYFKIPRTVSVSLEELTKIISIDDVTKEWIYAYANFNEYKKLISLKILPVILKKTGNVGYVRMADNPDKLTDWDAYPTYETYIQMMNDFANNYPDICQLIDAGNTVNGRKILFVKITDNVSQREMEPQFMYSSTMHGDETTGYVLMLRLIDYLLTNYPNDTDVAYLVDNFEIWINPLANPDGTYRSGNNTVNGATRYNANGYDLNRNFPDPDEGQNPTGTWQPETIAMMNIAEQNHFVLSANFHGGAEVVNYPWDTWSRRHPDDDWFKLLSHAYADTAQANSPATYMSGFDDGITNGWDWYPIYGGRQDYFTYFRHGRETTIELSDIKLLPASQLPQLWNYNYRALLNYIKFARKGILGKVTDFSGNPLSAKIIIENHDADSSEAVTDPSNGFYIRLLKGGTYNLTFSAEGYQTKTVNNIFLNENGTSTLSVMLEPANPIPVELTSFSAEIVNSKIVLFWETATEVNNRGFEIEMSGSNNNYKLIGFIEGHGSSSEINKYSFSYEPQVAGTFNFRLKQIDYDGQYEYSNVVEIKYLPTEFMLYQNYPNPFNPTTEIKFKLNEKSKVLLLIYDTLGREVVQLINKIMEPGLHSVNFNASGFSSGIYYYKLKTQGFIATKKMILIK